MWIIRSGGWLLALFMICMISAPLDLWAAKPVVQPKTVSVNLQNVTLFEALEYLTNVKGCKLLYNHEQVRSNIKINLVMSGKSIEQVLDKCLENTNLMYRLIDNVYVISMKPASVQVTAPQKNMVISGTVVDVSKHPVAGATIIVKGTNIGCSSDPSGHFELKVADSKGVILVASFIGMKTTEAIVKSSTPVMIVMNEDTEVMQDVVVTGYVNIDKRSFTGNAVSISREELVKASPRNVFAAVQAYDASVRMLSNDIMGSNPNALPVMSIRGNSSLAVPDINGSISQTNLRNDPNQPIYIMDGFEVTAEKLYDYDINRIENIVVLKDAAATAMYGSRAANGVWVITSVAPKPGRVRVNYIMQGEITVPDISDYNMMNSREKLAAELAAGYYGEGDAYLLNSEYNLKMNEVNRGVNTDWLAQPLKTAFNHKHSIYVDGGTEDLRFGVDFKYDAQGGVMKESFRNRTGVGIAIDYRLKGLQIRNYVSYNNIKSQESPYGKFSDYTSKLPYDQLYDELGNVVPNTKIWHNGMPAAALTNPLYESTLNNFDRSAYNEFIDNLNINYNITRDLQFKGSFSITKTDNSTDIFYDPASMRYDLAPGGAYDQNKGQLTKVIGSDLRWNVNAFLAYNKYVKKHSINASLGLNVISANSESSTSMYRGFPSGAMSEPAYAKEMINKPTFTEDMSRLVGAVMIVNYSYNNIYIADVSCRMDGSSQFGANRRYAPFWSGGLGVNIHNYASMQKYEWLSELKLRGSYGQLGKVNFPPYAAIPTYTIYDSWYSTGFGGIMNYMGNENLSWEVTNTLDVGFNLDIMKGLVRMKASYYHKKTVDALTDVNISSSSGFKSYKDNIGEVLNQGVDIDLRVGVIRNSQINVALWGNFLHNKNEILKISDAISAYNKKVDEYYSDAAGVNNDKTRPNTKFSPGGSTSSLYAMRSMGIDPSNGREMFLKQDGTITYDWAAGEQVIVGNTAPKGSGSFGLNMNWKNFDLYVAFRYEFGAQRYNSTLVSKVENVDIYNKNTDLRVLTGRWQNVGDVSAYKNIKDKTITSPSSRFVQDYNSLDLSSISLGYEFTMKALKNVGISSLHLYLDANNVFNVSSVLQERGLSYPFARSFSFKVNLNF